MSRGESAAWQEAYHSDALKRRRETTYARKLRRLGLDAPARGGVPPVVVGGVPVSQHSLQHVRALQRPRHVAPLHAEAVRALHDRDQPLPVVRRARRRQCKRTLHF